MKNEWFDWVALGLGVALLVAIVVDQAARLL